MVTNYYLEKRTFLKNYIKLKRKLSKKRKTSSSYRILREEANEEKRKFYNAKIDDILENWNNYDCCPGRRWRRAITGLVKTINEQKDFND
jgi:hypothetical protein